MDSINHQRTEVTNRVILDVDAGIDDAIAILIFLYAMKLNILKIDAIVCTDGNTARDNVVRNVVRLLETEGHTEIPIYKGTEKKIIPVDKPLDHHFGFDGFGDLNDGYEANLTIVRDTPGVIAMHDLVIKNPNKITIIALGPLTNVAITSRLYSDFLPNVKDIFIMGGNYEGIGNTVRGSGEFNFVSDPEAAYMLFNGTQRKVHVLPWETCLASTIRTDWRFKVLGQTKRPGFQLINRAEKNVTKFGRNWTSCGGQLAAAFIQPELITSRKDYCVEVELHGWRTRGQVVINRKCEANADMFIGLDFEAIRSVLKEVAGV